MNRLFQQPIVGLAIAGIVFAVAERYLHLKTWPSMILAAALVAVTFVGQALEYVKKSLEIAKLGLETSKLRREAKADQRAEETDQRLVKPATVEEVDKYAVAFAERKLRARYELTERERITSKLFIAADHEKRE